MVECNAQHRFLAPEFLMWKAMPLVEVLIMMSKLLRQLQPNTKLPLAQTVDIATQLARSISARNVVQPCEKQRLIK
jgi:hypothetical protein